MGKIVASFDVHITLREPDPIEAPADGTVSEPIPAATHLPTNGELVEAVEEIAARSFGYAVNATATRTDK